MVCWTVPMRAHPRARMPKEPRIFGPQMASDGLGWGRPRASNLQVGGSIPSGRAKRDGHFWVVGISPRHPTVPELCLECAQPR
jgi:hypothetical protein